jgi:pimeloyl-ACP methyl ester carboxylesterase
VLELAAPDRAELVDIGRGRWRLWSWGDTADPAVLLLHGAFDHGRAFDGIAPSLAALGLHVVAPDLRGHGDSSPLDSGYTWTLLLTELALLVDHLGGSVGIVAHSFGAGLAGGVAGVSPERVRWLVCLDGLGPPVAALGPPVEVGGTLQREFARADRDLLEPRRAWPSLEAMVERRRQGSPRLAEEWARHLALHGSRPADDGEGFVWKADPRFGSATPSDFDVDMLQAEMRAVRCPVLVLMGTEADTWRDLTPDEEDERAGWLRARLIRIPDAGHYVHLEQPEIVLDEVRGFLAEVGS